MTNEEKERRCKSCSKLLLDEKIPFCRRCVLEGRNKVGKVGVFLSGLTMTIWSTKTLVDNNSNSNNQN